MEVSVKCVFVLDLIILNFGFRFLAKGFQVREESVSKGIWMWQLHLIVWDVAGAT